MGSLKRIDGPSCPYGYKWRGYPASVYLGTHRDTDEPAVIKKVLCDQYSKIPIGREINILFLIRGHPNIVGFRYSLYLNDVFNLYFDYVDKNLEELIKDPINPILPTVRKEYLRQILSGIAHCHSKGVLHRHLEPKFILVDTENERVKIAEFGEALGLKNPNLYVNLGDPNFGYRAPELLLCTRQFSFASDVWAVGCIFAAMVRHETLFHGVGMMEELNSIFSLLGMPDESIWFGVTTLCEHMSSEPYKPKDLKLENWGRFGLEDTGLDLLRKMMCYNPKDRITAEDALRHPYFADSSSGTTMHSDTTMHCCTTMHVKRKFEDVSSG